MKAEPAWAQGASQHSTGWSRPGSDALSAEALGHGGGMAGDTARASNAPRGVPTRHAKVRPQPPPRAWAYTIQRAEVESFDRMTSADPNYNSHRAQRLRWRPYHAQHSLRTQKSVTALHGGLRKRLRSSGTLQDGLLGCNDKMMQHAPGYCGGLHEPSRPRESHTRDAAGTSAADGRWSVVP